MSTENWAAVVGFVAPLIIAVIKQQGWDGKINDMLVFALCVVFGVGTAWFGGELHNPECPNLIECLMPAFDIIGIVLVSAFAWYKMLWKPSGIDEAITSKTSVVK